MKWEIEYTDEFEHWWDTLSEAEQESIAVSVDLLEIMGPNLPRPHSDTVKGSRFNNMKELRTQHAGAPGHCMRLIREEQLYSYLAGTKPVTVIGIKHTYPLPINCSLTIWNN